MMARSIKTAPEKARVGRLISIAAWMVFLAVLIYPLPEHWPLKTISMQLKGLAFYMFKHGAEWLRYLYTTRNYAALDGGVWMPLAHAVGILVTFITAIGLTLRATYLANNEKEYGEGQIAELEHIKKMRLFGKKGIVLGKVRTGFLRWRYLIPQDIRHCYCIAPNRTGKTAANIIPSIVNYPGSVIVIDPKSELQAKTAAARRKIGPVYVIDWSNENSPHAWSPVAFNALPKSTLEIERLCERIISMLFPETTGSDAYWNKTARRNGATLLMYDIYEALETNVEPNIGRLVSRLTGDLLEMIKKSPDEEGASRDKRKKKSKEQDDPFGDHLLLMAATAVVKGWPKRISDDLALFANSDFRERSAHLNTLIAGIQLFRLEAVQASTRTASFSFQSIQKRPATIYIRFPQKDAKAFGPLTAFFLEGFFSFILDSPMQDGDVPIWLALDEFASLPKIPLMLDFLAKGAGNGAHATIVTQDFAQTEEIYGKTGLATILTNCNFIQAFSQNNTQTADMLSRLVGQTTRLKKTISGSWLKWYVPSVTESNEGRPVIQPEDWGRLPKGYNVVIVQGFTIYPILAKSTFWFLERFFKRLVTE